MAHRKNLDFLLYNEYPILFSKIISKFIIFRNFGKKYFEINIQTKFKFYYIKFFLQFMFYSILTNENFFVFLAHFIMPFISHIIA